MRSLRQNMERLEGWYPNLFLEPHRVAAVTVLSEYSDSPAFFDIHGENVPQLAATDEEFRLALSWHKQRKRRPNDCERRCNASHLWNWRP